MAYIALLVSAVPALAQTSLSVDLGSTSAVQTANVTLTGSGTLSSIVVLTEGVNNRDFQLSSYSCAPGTYYPAGTVCTIGYTFAPKYAGLSHGGISLRDSGGNPLGIAYISGIGVGPEIAIYPTSSSFPTGTRVAFTAPGEPQYLAIDGAGTIYFYTRNASTGNGSIIKATHNSDGTYTQSTIATFNGIGSGIGYGVTGLAVDGLGNVFYTYLCTIVEMMPTNSGYNSSVVLQNSLPCEGFTNEGDPKDPIALAVDANGAIYVGAYTNYYKFSYSGTGYGSGSAISYAYYPNDIFVDASANMYAAEGGDGQGLPAIIEAYDSGGTYSQEQCEACGFFPPDDDQANIYSLFLDPSGSMVYGLGSVSPLGIKKLHRDRTVVGLITNVTYVITTIRMDAQGDIFFITGDSTNNIYEIPVTPTVNFGSITSGTSKVMPFSMMNIGTGTLTARSPGLQVTSAPFSQSTKSNDSPADCSTTFSLSPDGSCSLNLSFAPPSTANSGYSATLSVNDNTLSSSSAVQQIPVSGTAVHAPPTISSISPSVGGYDGGSTFVITGTYLGDVSSVTFGTCYGTFAASFTIDSTTQITAVSTLGCPSGTATITITNPGGSATTGWTYNPAASAANSSLSIAASSIPQNGTTTLTATVKDSNGNPIVDAAVSFSSSVAGLANAPTVVTNSSGVATSTVTGFFPGSTILTAQVLGVSISKTVALTVTDTSVAVGSSLAGQQGVLTITTAGTLANTLALTQGASNADFTLTSNSCTAGTPYVIGATCAITYTASPKAPGLRTGAIVMENSSGTPLGTLYLSIIGNGPQGLFSPATQSTVLSGLNSPAQAIVDGLGNVFFVENEQIMKFAGGTTTSLAFNGSPGGLVLDGAGNLFYTDTFYRNVYELVNATGTARIVASFNSSSTLSAPIAVDALGNLYVTASGTIYELAAGTFATSTIATGIVPPAGMVVDSSGNIYFSESSAGVISEVAAGTTTAVAIASGLSRPGGIVIDAAGNLYVGTNASLLRLAASSRSPSIVSNVSSQSVWITGNGTLWTIDSGNIVTLNRAASSAAFSTNLGGATAPQVMTLENDGNIPLTLSSLSTTTPFSLNSGTTNCTSTTTIAAAGTCSLGIVFTPSAAGTVSGTTTLKDNSLNVTGTTQTISLSGTGYSTQTITFPQPVTPALPGTTATLTATASSGLPVTYTIVSGPATVSGSTITYTDSGTVVISASQPGNANYSAASSVSVTVVVGGLNTTVGTTGSTQTIQITISAAGTLQTINVLTQGASNLDYKYVTGSTDPNACKVGAVYAVGAPCTVQYSFTPSRPGQRLGAVSLTSTAASVMGTALLSDIGTGGMLTFPGSTAINTLVTGMTTPTAVAVNGNGDVFYATDDGIVEKLIAVNGVVNASSQSVVVGNSDFYVAQYIAVDGAGDVFVTALFNGTNSSGTVSEIVAVNGVVTSSSPVVVIADGLNYPEGVAVDGSGNVFVSDSFNNVVKEIVAVNGKVSTSSAVNIVSSGLDQPQGIAVDASGDVFAADPSYSSVVEFVAVNGLVNSGSTTKYLNGGFVYPYAVAVDASGDVFVADPGDVALSNLGQGAALKEIVAVNGLVSSSSTVITLGSGFQAKGVALDGSGHVFVADTNSGTYKELDLTTAPTLAFASGSATLSATVQNAGNAPLTFTGLATSSSNFALDATATTCSVGTPLVADGLCNVGADFTPQASGAVTGTINLTDNSLNVAGSQQRVPLTGTRGTTAQTITFPQPVTPVPNGSAPVTLTATSTSGIPVTYSVISGPATVSGSTLVYTGAGTVVVEADQPGNATYAAASPVQKTITVVAVTSYAAPTTAIGSSATQTATVTLLAGGTLGVVSVVTQGAQNLDFTFASGGSCVSGAAFLAGQSCTVNYNFTPTAPGARQGAVLIYSNATTPALLATVFLQGTGTSPLAVFSQGAQSIFATVQHPTDAAFDGTGNLYVSDSTSDTLDKITPGGVLSQLVTNVNSISGVGVDGAGNVFYASTGNSNISELYAAAGAPTVVIGAAAPGNSLVFDATGNFYVELGSSNNGQIWKYNPEANTGSFILQGGTYGIGRVIGMTQDAAGNLYLADFDHNSVYVLNAGATAPTLLTSVGLSSPDGIAIDPAGNLYVSNYGASASNGLASLVKIPAGCTMTTCQTVLATGFSASFTKIDSSGNLYVGDLTDGTVVKITRTTTPPLSFPPTTVNTSSPQQAVAIENDGTSALNFSAITGNTADAGGAATTCATNTPLASAAVCTLGVRFAPTSPTSVSGTVTLSDNSLNNSASTQIISVTGASTNNPQTIVFTQPITPVVPGSTAVLTGSASSGLPVTFSVPSGSASISTVAGVSTITYGPGLGNVIITASQTGNSTYSAATSVSRTVTVAAAPVITFNQLVSPVLAGTSVNLVASSTQSATPIVFTITSGLATLSGTTLTFNGAGTVIVAANQAGNSAYPAAVTVSQSVTVVRSSTTTTLTVTAAGNPVISTTSGTVVTLTAKVLVGSSPVTVGQVNFCDGTPCTFAHLLGTAQIVQYGAASGTATFRYSPGPGAHSFTAAFVQTNTDSSSASAPAALNAASANPNTVTTLGVSGSVGYYTLTGSVTGSLAAAPSGTLLFLDTTNGGGQVGSAPLVAGASTFSNSKSVLSGVVNYPQGMAVGDFNNDGIADLATANIENTTATVFLGTGLGQYSNNDEYANGSYCYSIAVADFNGDGNADMAVDCANEVSILLGYGNGNFNEIAPAFVPTNGVSYGIATGDFNGDGIADLAIANTLLPPYPGNSVTILLGNGDGTFTQGTSPATGQGTLSYGSGPIAIAVSDFNGDGILDLAVLNQDSNNIVILLGNGDGTFAAQAASPSTGQSPTSITVGDFNGDGIADLAVAAGTFSTQLTVLQGKGDGTFTPLASPNLGTQAPFFIGAGDLDGDGQTDLATSNYDISTGNMTVSVLHGNGDGTFAAPVTSIANTPGGQAFYPGGIVVADLNGDGLVDVAEASADEYDGNTTSDLGAIFLSAVSTTATATATGVSPAGTGTHNVEAVFAAEGNYLGSTSAPMALTAFTRQAKTITFPALAPSVTLGSTGTLNATASNGDPVTYSLTSGVASITGTTVTYTTIGQVTITASSAATGVYNAATPVSQTINVQPAIPLVFIAGSGGVASLNSFGIVTTSATPGGTIGVAVDATGYVWSLNGTSLAKFSPAGTLVGTFAATGLNGASALAIDGNSNIWVANGNGTISIVSNSGTSIANIAGSTTSAPSSVAIDLSGNVWVANTTANTVDEVIGGASPASPLVNAVQNNTPGTRP